MLASRIGPPLVQVLHVIGLNGVLIQGSAGAAADTDVLRGLQKRLRHRQPIQLRTQTVDDRRALNFALL